MNIAPPILREIPTLVELGHLCHLESRFSRLPYDAERVAQRFKHMIEQPLSTTFFVSANHSSGQLHGLMIGSVDEYFFCLDTGRIITGENLEFLLSIFNSNIFFFAIKHFYGGGGLGATGVRMKHTFFEHFPCINTQNLIETLSEKTNQIIQNKATGINTHTLEEEAETLINNAYGLTQEEIQFIDFL